MIVNSGIVDLWGLVGSQDEYKALVAVAEGVPGVVSVSDEIFRATKTRHSRVGKKFAAHETVNHADKEYVRGD